MSRYPTRQPQESPNRVAATTEHLSFGVMQTIRKNLMGDESGEHIKEKAGNSRFHLDMALVEFRKYCARMGAAPATIERRIETGIEILNKGFGLCESPIERMILPWLIFGAFEDLAPCPVPVHDAKSDVIAPAVELFIVPQFAFAKFRADFALIHQRDGVASITVLECDGEEFHKDKRKDFDREQYLKSFGIRVVRATGNEIHTEPQAVFSRLHRQVFEGATARNG